eukprot:TRINITY_DN17719_c0_g1_i1.p1 TRINITY_DN17719_c0_g1~~TRINITY_DN17719_c0_g1_i1.p1  ORF type:complete len:474 (+),score=85.84 TRINITY_DN17719_c0_g1_i1:117-1424(+)
MVKYEATPSSTIADLKAHVQQTQGVPVAEQTISILPDGSSPLSDGCSLGELGVQHGQLLHVTYAGSATIEIPSHIPSSAPLAAPVSKEPKAIIRNGVVVPAAPAPAAAATGEKKLRDIRAHWTYAQFEAHLASLQVEIKQQKESHCQQVQLSYSAANAFQSFCRDLDFRTQRVGLCFGTVGEDHTIAVHLIYEPPQNGTQTDFQLLPDPKADTVYQAAALLGLEPVGWIVSHHFRTEILTGTEVVQAARFQSACARKEFVTLTVSLTEEGLVQFQAYQVSDQAVELVSDAAEDGTLGLRVCPTDAGKVTTRKIAIVEKKEAAAVPCEFFLVNVAVHPEPLPDSFFTVDGFPIENREAFPQLPEHAAKFVRALQKTEGRQWCLAAFRNFHFLLFLERTGVLTLNTDVPAACTAILTGDLTSLAGFELMIKAIFLGE